MNKEIYKNMFNNCRPLTVEEQKEAIKGMKAEKQIEEMAKILNRACVEDECSECPYQELRHEEYACLDLNMASTLYTAGYRKSTDVAREIFTWFDENAVNLNFVTGNFEVNFGRYLELKKKYTEGKDEDIR